MHHRFIALAATALLSVSPSLAAPITANTFETFTRQTFGNLPSEFTGGPREAGREGDSVIFTSTNVSSVFAYDSAYGLNTNGDWGGGRRGFVGLNTAFGTLRFDFARPVSGVGAFINYSPPSTSFGEATLRVLGVGDVVLEEFNVSRDAPISTPNAVDGGAFRGFNRLAGVIVAFELSDGFVVLDNLTWSRDNVATPKAIPIPSSSLLFMVPLAFAALRRRRPHG